MLLLAGIYIKAVQISDLPLKAKQKTLIFNLIIT